MLSDAKLVDGINFEIQFERKLKFFESKYEVPEGALFTRID